MAFDTYRYTSDDGDQKPIRLEAETADAGSFPAGTGLDDRDFVKVSKGNREFGMRPRGVRLRRRASDGIRYKFLPIATTAAFDAILSAGTVTIGGTAWNVTSPVPEDV